MTGIIRVLSGLGLVCGITLMIFSISPLDKGGLALGLVFFAFNGIIFTGSFFTQEV